MLYKRDQKTCQKDKHVVNHYVTIDSFLLLIFLQIMVVAKALPKQASYCTSAIDKTVIYLVAKLQLYNEYCINATQLGILQIYGR